MQGAAAMAHFKTNLKQLMLKKSVELDRSLNRSDVAELTGLSLPTISRWYNGTVKTIESETIKKLTDFFGCQFAELVEYVGED